MIEAKEAKRLMSFWLEVTVFGLWE